MDRLWRTRVPGPLEPYADGFREDLQRHGYSPWTIIWDLTTMSRLSSWLVVHRLDPSALTTAELRQFLQNHRFCRGRDPRGVPLLLRYLRGLGVVPKPAPSAADPLGRLVDEFAVFLIQERGLAAGTVWFYRTTAKRFLSNSASLDAAGDVMLHEVTVEAVRSFVIGESRRRGVGSVKNVVTALRSLLRFLHLRGELVFGLADAIPAIANWHRQSLPATPQAGVIATLLASCDRGCETGRRDYAILVLLSRLGLRIGEVAALTIDDLNWRAAEISVCGKGNRHDKLPLPVDVGAAIADYCRQGRRVVDAGCRALFLNARAPYATISTSGVGRVVTRACDRAGLPRMGPHLLRHAAATAPRQAGAPLLEIGQILRHAHPVTTAGYGAIATGELAVVARRWPAVSNEHPLPGSR